MKKKTAVRIIVIIIALIIVATVVAYNIYNRERPWLAFFIACCGGVLATNLAISLIFVVKNFKDKGRK